MSRHRSVAASVRRRNNGPRWRRNLHSTGPRKSPYNSLDEFLRNTPDGDFFGDDPEAQSPTSTRVSFQNLQGVPASRHDDKQLSLNDWLRKEDVGIALLSESNRHWPSVPRGHKWSDRIRSVSQDGHFSSVSWNSRQKRLTQSSYQIGGCSVSLLGKTAHSARTSGQDSSGLGRWAWCRIQGKARRHQTNDVTEDPEVRTRTQDLIVVSAYRPCGPGTGPSTVWAQHKDFLLSKGRQEDPREAFVRDLLSVIDEWMKLGCEIILGIDANEDLSKSTSSSFRARLAEIGMTERILTRHPQSPPATQIDNTRNEPIDGIFSTAGVKVNAGGYYGFYESVESDHRALWLDIDLFTTLGGFQPKSTKPPRKLSNSHRATRRRYIRYSEASFRQYKIPQRLVELQRELLNNNGKMSTTMESKFNSIHNHARISRRNAEEKCRKIRKGGKPWSPKSQEIRDRIYLWRVLLNRLKGNRVSSRLVRRLMAKTRFPDSYKWDASTIQSRLSNDLCLLRKLKRSRLAEWRKDFVSLSKANAAKSVMSKKTRHNRERAERLQKMRQREETRRRKKAQGKGFSGGLKMIQIEREESDGSTVLVSCSEQRVVEQACMQENTERYDQTRSPFPTPPMLPSLYNEFNGPSAEDNMDALLKGSWEVPAHLDPATKAFLRQCRSNLPSSPLEVTRKSNNAFWRKNPELKGSEPHGLHNSHYKASTFSLLLSSCDAAFRDIPLKTGIAPTAWRNLMNFAIEKKAGDFRVKKMRTIQLMDAEFQANNKLVGQQAMKRAESSNMIPPGQCGSRKRHQAIDLALSKALVWDQLLLLRQPAGWILNDAKSCFDRVVHWVAQVALRRFGIPWATVDMMFRTLRWSKHRVRTGFGDAEEVFEPPSLWPFQGCGQGNGAGPTIWVAISSILIDAMTAHGHGFDFLSAIDQCLSIAECFCFVDDTDLVEAASSSVFHGEFLICQIQRALSLWSGCVRATGGAINPEKSFWWLIDFAWNQRTGKWSHCSIDSTPGDIRIPDLQNRMVKLVRLRPDQCEKTLGIWMSPQFQGNDQFRHLLEKSKAWSATVRSGKLLPYDVFPLIRTTIMKSLEYSAALTHFSSKQWDKILWPIMSICLPKAKICRSFPKAVIYGPQKYQGLGLPHPQATQTFKQLDMLLRHPANRTTTGRFLESSLQAHQLETGTSYGLLQQVYSNTSILASDTWLKRVWKDLDLLDVHVEFESPSLHLQCTNDRLLMDIFIEAEVDQSSLKWLNWCRMHLHATTLSDITTADGRTIQACAWKGHRSHHLQSNYTWPRTERPPDRWWRLWQHTLSSILLRNIDSRRLTYPLGNWSDDIRRWKWVYSPSKRRLFHREGQVWIRCPRLLDPPIRSRNDIFAKRIVPEFYLLPLPSDVQRATVSFFPDDILSSHRPLRRVQHLVKITGLGSQIPSLPPPVSIMDQWSSLKSMCSALSGWVPDLIEIEGSESALLDALLKGEVCIISDGSYQDEVGSAATQLTTRSGKDKIWAICQTPGSPKDQSAYRSEGAGVLMGVQLATWLRLQAPAGFLSNTRPKVVQACDGKAALFKAFDDWPLKSNSSQFDLFSAIREAVRQSFLSWHPLHVLGHQDDKNPSQRLSWWALRNIECDARAKAYRVSLQRSKQAAPNPRFFTERSALFISNIKQSRLKREALDDLITLPPLLAYWERRQRLSHDALREIDWDQVGKMMHALPSGIQRWVTKHATGMCGVGKFKLKWKYTSVNECPRCSEEEDKFHVLRCPSVSAESEWDLRTDLLQQWMIAAKIAPEIRLTILHFLRCVRGPPRLLSLIGRSVSTRFPSLLMAAIRSQKVIGVQCMVEGLLSKHWATLQQQQFLLQGSRRSGPKLISQLSSQLVMLGFHMWQHRNGAQHSEDNIQLRFRRQDVDSGIREQYLLGLHGLPSGVRHLLRRSKATTLSLPLTEREAWLRILQRTRQGLRETTVRQRALMRSTFLPLPIQPSFSTRHFSTYRTPPTPLVQTLLDPFLCEPSRSLPDSQLDP